MSSATALLRAAHIEPTIAVTALATTLAASAGRDLIGCVLVAAAVLTGQLSIGWSNDLIDLRRDRQAGRDDKPLARGEISTRAVRLSCAMALCACVPLSFSSGWRAGIAHLAVVAGGWAYNLGLKKTWLSWLPYATSFGLLAAFIPLGLPGHPSPQVWLVAAGSLLGVGAHFLNVVPDVEDDLSTGVRGLPQRCGPTRARGIGAVLLALAAVVVTFGPEGRVPSWAYFGLALAWTLALLAAVLGRGGGSRSRLPFLLAIATAAVSVLLLVARGPALS